ncbi:ash family protein [Frederiksenia canicola]
MKIMSHQKQVYFNANHSTITTDSYNLSMLVASCKKLVKADRLQKGDLGGSIESTISFNADRKRYLSGIFLPAISQSYGITTPEVYSELAVRATRRTKTGNRTNNADCLKAVVEPLPHPIEAVSFNHKLTRTFKMLFKFLLLGEKRLTVRIRAKSEAEARQCIQFTSPAICIARFSDNLTACSANSLHETGKPCTKDAIFLARNVQPTEQKTILHPLALIGYSAPVIAKSIASREKLNNLHMANDSTPLTRAFFVRSLRTPKENAFLKNKERSFLSMVGRIGQRLGVGCVPYVAVSHPDTLYRPAVRSKAVDIKNLHMELSQMFYKFLFTGSRLRITVFANNLAEAYKRLPLSQSKPVLIARLPVQGGVYA